MSFDFEPAFSLDEPEKHQTIEEGLREQTKVVTLQRSGFSHNLFNSLESRFIFLVEHVGELFHVERARPLTLFVQSDQPGEVVFAKRPQRRIVLIPPKYGERGGLGLADRRLEAGEAVMFVTVGSDEEQVLALEDGEVGTLLPGNKPPE